MDSEKWTFPEIASRSPWLAANLPPEALDLVRWRFICREEVLCAVTLGLFGLLRPERVPVAVRPSRLFDWKTRPMTDAEREARRD